MLKFVTVPYIRQLAHIDKTALFMLLLAALGLLLAGHLLRTRQAEKNVALIDPVEAVKSRQAITALLFAPAKETKHPDIVPPRETQVETVPPPVRVKQRDNNVQVDSQFVKISFQGHPLGADETYWSCARDLKTGLLWEVKLSNSGISDFEHTYSWYQPERDRQGKENGGKCFGIACDTSRYVQEMNRLELCGATTWRLPTFLELEGLIDRNYYNPTINQEYFPNTQGTVYWTSTELENNLDMVMQIDFFNGMSNAVPKNLNYHLRLVSP